VPAPPDFGLDVAPVALFRSACSVDCVVRRSPHPLAVAAGNFANAKSAAELPPLAEPGNCSRERRGTAAGTSVGSPPVNLPIAYVALEAWI
jgi:hypothetical protein